MNFAKEARMIFYRATNDVFKMKKICITTFFSGKQSKRMSLTLLFVLIFAHWHFVVHSQSVLTRYKYCASPPIWVLSMAISMSFLSIDSHISKTTRPNFTNFLHLLPVAWSFSDDSAVCQSTSVLWMIFNRWRTVVSGTWKYDDPRLKMLHEGVLRTTVCHMFCHMANYKNLTVAKREWVSSAI